MTKQEIKTISIIFLLYLLFIMFFTLPASARVKKNTETIKYYNKNGSLNGYTKQKGNTIRMYNKNGCYVGKMKVSK